MQYQGQGASGVNIPAIGPTFSMAPQGMLPQGMPQGVPQNVQQPSAPTDFMQLLGQQPTNVNAQPAASGNAAAEQVLQLFGQLLNNGSTQTTTTTSASAAAGAPTSTLAAEPAAAWQEMLKDFNVQVEEPDFIKDTAKLSAFFDTGLNQIDFMAGLASDDPNAFMRAAMKTMLMQAVQSSFLAAKTITSGSIPAAFQEYAKRTYRDQQLGAVKQSEAVPQSMGFVAQALAEKFMAAKPNATPEQVKQAIGLLMTNLQQAFQPAATTSTTQPSTDWASFLNN